MSLQLSYTADESSANNVRGNYRLRVDPYSGMCNAAAVYYSNSFAVQIGYPLTDVVLSTDYSQSEMSSGICMGTELNFSVEVPDGAGTVMGYQ